MSTPPIRPGDSKEANSAPPPEPAVPGAGNISAGQATIAMPMDDISNTKPTQAMVPSGQAEEHQGKAWGDFELGQLLGKGGMGAVYRGRQISLDRPVAIKVLPPHLGDNELFKKRFLLEARAVAQISSPHVVQVYAAGVHEAYHYFAMEFVEGQDLGRKLRQGFRPSTTEALDLVMQAARGLAAAGDLGIIHRDIKPANMMVTTKNLVKIMDFGLVRLARSEDTGLTRAGTIMGTVSYFSPEQGRGEPCDQRTDIYALGVVFYELLTGQLPFTGDDATSVIYQHIHVKPKLPREINPGIPEDYQAVVLKCLQKDPAHRYQNAQELLADLDDLRQGNRPHSAFLDVRQLRHGSTLIKEGEFSHERARRTALIGTLSAVGLLIAGGVAYVLSRPDPVVPPLIPPVETPAPKPVEPTTGPAKPPVDAEKPVKPPVEPAKPVDTGNAQLMTLARAHLNQRRFSECRTLVEANRALRPDDADWTALAQELDRSEGRAALQDAQVAYNRGDYPTATTLLATARARGVDETSLATLTRNLSEREAERRAQTRRPDATQQLLTTARAHLSQRRFAECRTLVEANRAARPDDADWSALALELDRSEGRAACEDAIAAYDRGDYQTASTLLATARARTVDDGSLTTLAKNLAEREAERLARVKRFEEANQLLAEGKAAQAEELLLVLKRQAPGDAAIEAALAKATTRRQETEALVKAVQEALERGDRALERRDIDGAAAAYAAARDREAGNARAAAGLDAVAAARAEIAGLRKRFDQAITDRDPAGAEQHLAALAAKAPGSATVTLAQQDLAALKSTLEQERKAAAEREARFSGEAKAVSAKLDDPATTIAQGEELVKQFLATAGSDRPEKALLLEKLEDRRTRSRIVTLLAGLDQAVAKRDQTAIQHAVDDADFAKALVALASYPGLVFESRLATCTRSGRTSTATVRIRHALAVFPERILTYRYDLRETDQGWVIAAAHLQQ